jgi:hypothetical protein
LTANEKVDLWAVDEVHFPATRVAPPGCGFLRKSRSGAAAKSPGYPDFDGRSLFLYLIPTGIAVDVSRDGTILFGESATPLPSRRLSGVGAMMMTISQRTEGRTLLFHCNSTLRTTRLIAAET